MQVTWKSPGGVAGLPGAILRVGAYLAIGAGCHYLAVGERFDPHSTLSWAWVGAWPFCAAFIVLKWALPVVGAILLAMLAVGAVCGVIVWLNDRKAKRAAPVEFRRRSYSEAGPAHHDTTRRH